MRLGGCLCEGCAGDYGYGKIFFLFEIPIAFFFLVLRDVM
jgi:hypothetical protein